jgi:predicted GTPase
MSDAEALDPLDFFESCLAQSRAGLGRATVAVLGRAGAGKSTLINAVFGAGVAETGVGAPVTGSLAEYRVPRSSLTLLDSWGLELGGQALEGASRVVAEEIERRAALPLAEALHVVWYCVDTSSDRFEPAEEELVRRCAARVPTIVVLTKAVDPGDDALRRHIEGLGLPVEAVLPVLASERLGRAPYGIEALGATTASVLPEAGRRAFVVAQRYAIEQQVVEARGTVQRRSLAAAQLAVGARGLDPDRLARHQLRMLAELTVLFSLSVPDVALKGLVAGLGRGTTTLTGLVARLLELLEDAGVPGMDIADRLVTGAAAVASTRALGEGFVKLCRELAVRELEGRPAPADLLALFKDLLR